MANMTGTAGNDSLTGTAANDLFDGLAGNDTLKGGAGDDTYLFGLGAGKDIISSAFDSRATRLEILSFKAGVLPTDIQASFVGNNLVLAIKGTTDSITIQDFKYLGTPANGYNPIQLVKFSNGTTWNTAQMTMAALTGTAAAEKLIGTDNNDQLNGFGGNDTLQGGGGDDTYLFGRGDGKDLISREFDSRATRQEILTFKAGVLPTDIQGSFVGNDLVLAIKGTTDSITIENFKYLGSPTNGYNPIQLVKFANGTTWNATQMVTAALTGTSAADTLIGTNHNDRLDGLVGNDTLQGGGGDDTYLFGRGDGKDLISREFDSRTTRQEILSFKTGVLPADIQTSFVGNNLVLAIKGTTDSITIQDFKYLGSPSNGYNPIQLVKFANGTSWDLAYLKKLTGLSAAAPLATAQVDQLVSAMASFAAPTAAVISTVRDPLAQTRPIAIAVN